jgi:hypothetical protein
MHFAAFQIHSRCRAYPFAPDSRFISNRSLEGSMVPEHIAPTSAKSQLNAPSPPHDNGSAHTCDILVIPHILVLVVAISHHQGAKPPSRGNS